MSIRKINYYQRLNCFSYYRDGIQRKLERGEEIIMLSFFDNGLICISEFGFALNDVLILNIHLDRYPYEKLMCHITHIKRVGDFFEMSMEIMGIPNTLNERIRSSLDKLPEAAVSISSSERLVLMEILKRLLEEH